MTTSFRRFFRHLLLLPWSCYWLQSITGTSFLWPLSLFLWGLNPSYLHLLQTSCHGVHIAPRSMQECQWFFASSFSFWQVELASSWCSYRSLLCQCVLQQLQLGYVLAFLVVDLRKADVQLLESVWPGCLIHIIVLPLGFATKKTYWCWALWWSVIIKGQWSELPIGSSLYHSQRWLISLPARAMSGDDRPPVILFKRVFWQHRSGWLGCWRWSNPWSVRRSNLRADSCPIAGSWR